MHYVKKAKYLEGYKVVLTFEDKSEKIVDFQKLLKDFKGEIFHPLKDIEYFKTFRVEIGTISWPNDADYSPDALYKFGKKFAQKKKAI